jgi:hypothetical protein
LSSLSTLADQVGACAVALAPLHALETVRRIDAIFDFETSSARSTAPTAPLASPCVGERTAPLDH